MLVIRHTCTTPPVQLDTPQKLEAELKQSYATKNYTLKSGLLDIEKRFRSFIYASQDVEVGGACLTEVEHFACA